MEEFKIPKKLFRLTEAVLRRMRCNIKLFKDVSDLFIIHQNMRQGDALSCSTWHWKK